MTADAPPPDPIDPLRQEIAILRQQIADLTQAIGALDERIAPRQRWDDPADPPAPASPAGYPILPRAWPVRFGHIAPPDHFLGSGWWPREDWGVWGTGTSRLCFSLPPDYDARHAVLALAIQAFIPAGGPLPKLDVVANGYFLGSHLLRRAHHKLRLKLPASAIASPDIVLELRYDRPISAADADVSADGRPLGIGLIAIELL